MLAPLLALGILASGVEVDTEVRAEVLGGVVRPPNLVLECDEPPCAGARGGIPAADLHIAPSGDLRYVSPHFLVEAGYAPDLTARASTLGLVTFGAHRARGRFRLGPERGGIRVEGSAGATVGTVDAMMMGGDVGQQFGAAPRGGVIPIAAATARLGVVSQASSRWQLSSHVELSGFLVQSVADTPTFTLPAIPSFLLGSFLTPLDDEPLDPRVLLENVTLSRYTLSRRLEWQVESRLLAAADQNGLGVLGTMPSTGVIWQATRRSTMHARAGVFAAHQRGPEYFDAALWPVFNVGAGTRIPLGGPAQIDLSASGGLSPFYDAFLGVVTQRAGVEARAGWQVNRELSLGAGAELFQRLAVLGGASHISRGTDVTIGGTRFDPLSTLGPVPAGTFGDDTIASASVDVTYLLSRHFTLASGVRGSARLSNPPLPIENSLAYQALAFVAIIYTDEFRF